MSTERPKFRQVESLEEDLLAVKEERISDDLARYYPKEKISEGVEDGSRYKYLTEEDIEKREVAQDELIQLYYTADTPELQKEAAHALGFVTEEEAEEDLGSRVDNIFEVLLRNELDYSPHHRRGSSRSREYLRWHLDKKSWRLFYHDPEATRRVISDQDIGHRVTTENIKVPPEDITPLFLKGKMKKIIREAWLLTQTEMPNPLKVAPLDLTSAAKRLVPFPQLVDRFNALKGRPG